ncbi:hypothetical protein GF339_20170, partial [candidate division KSB3 bacterium]|nr:hypothetical protein [candidate division KSB3 bacterium]MBD3326912.1 hypothetical protein [candidate division KSB3 bacterium]
MRTISRKKKILFSLVLLGITYLCLELLSLFVFFLVEGTFIPLTTYQKQRLALVDPEAVQQPLENRVVMSFKTREVIHPYLGFVKDPHTVSGHSEIGFPGERSPLRSPPDNALVIGIFGGSFAQGVALLGKDALIERLRQSPEFAERDIIIHTLAIGGYKQPQQVLTLTYLLTLGATFDIVINIDGFNEIVLPPMENIPKQVFPFYPRNWFIRVHNLQDTETLTMIGTIAMLNEQRTDVAKLFSTVPLRYSFIANFFWKYYDTRLATEQIIQGQH